MEETKMSIAGINGYNYSNYYTGTKRNTAKANGMNSGLLSNVSSTSSNITLHMSGTEDSGNALTAVGFPDGSSASVYKSDAYDSANPEYRVRYWDKEGNYTDTNVQINDVDPRNASYLEMLAYTTYSDVEGFTKNAFGDFMNAAGGVNGNITYDSDSINEKKDYMSMIKEFMQLINLMVCFSSSDFAGIFEPIEVLAASLNVMAVSLLYRPLEASERRFVSLVR